MKRFKEILLAFDGSQDSMEALDVAETLAKEHEAHLSVVYVHREENSEHVSMASNPMGGSFLFEAQGLMGPAGRTASEQAAIAEPESIIAGSEIPKYVMDQAKEKFTGTGIDVTYETLIGKTIEQIIAYAENTETDLIIIGNRGLSGFKRLVQGSISQKITNKANCPVFVVK